MPLERPQQDFVSYGNVAVANFGLPEYELASADAQAGAPGAIKLTLLRAVNYLGAGGYANTIIGGAGPFIETPDQQAIGRAFTMNYSIIPHKADVLAVQREAYQHNALWRGTATGKHSGYLPAEGLSFVNVTGEGIIVSAVKQVEDTPGEYVLRMWNSGTKDSAASVSWFKAPAEAWVCNMAEDKLKQAEVSPSGKAKLPLKAKAICTLRWKL